MEFHGTARVIEIGGPQRTAFVSEIDALQVPWNSMELLVSVPWNSMEPFLLFNGTIGIINALSFKMI